MKPFNSEKSNHCFEIQLSTGVKSNPWLEIPPPSGSRGDTLHWEGCMLVQPLMMV